MVEMVEFVGLLGRGVFGQLRLELAKVRSLLLGYLLPSEQDGRTEGADCSFPVATPREERGPYGVAIEARRVEAHCARRKLDGLVDLQGSAEVAGECDELRR